MKFIAFIVSLALIALTMSGSADARVGSDRSLKKSQACWVDVKGKYHGCDHKHSCDPDTWQCVAKSGGDVDKHGCKPSTGYTWCATTGTCERECPKKQCSRKCSNNYDCSNDGGRWDHGEPWCGLCDHGHCRPHYEDCKNDSDCGSKAVCGPHGTSVGK